MSDDISKVECEEHGTGTSTFVCQHLLDGEGLGFHRGFPDDDPDALWPDAWCDDCEAVRAEEGEWNDRSEEFASIRLMCQLCYCRARERNYQEDREAFDALAAEAYEYLDSRQQAASERYRLGEYESYEWSQGTGELSFSDGRRARVVADFQFVGSWSRRTETWMWSWANRSIEESVKKRVRRVRAHGEEQGFLKLIAGLWPATEEDGWEMTAIAAYLLGAKAAYRAPDDSTYSFVLMTDIRWVD